VLCLAAAALPAAAADDFLVKATLEPPVIGLGETATLTIEVGSSHLTSLGFHPDFKLDNLAMAGGASQVDNVQYVNGSFIRSFQMVFRLRPLATGKAAVRSLRLQIGDELRQLPDREITVQQAPTGPSDERMRQESQEPEDPIERLLGGPLFERRPEPARRPAAFLRAEIEPARPYAGQQALYTLYLYTRDDITSMASREMPAFQGFWVCDVPQPQHQAMEMVTVGNERFARVAVVQKALFPLRPGRYTIAPAAMDLLARVMETRWFAPPLTRPQEMTVRAPAVMLDVQPLPPAPPGFAGAVGQLALTARLEPAQLRLGEAATLTVTLAGRGNVQGVGEPRLTLPAELQTFSPQQQGDERVVGTAVQGTRSWSWVIVPKRTGRASLAVAPLPFFDPQSGQYRSAAVPALEVTTLAPATAVTASLSHPTAAGVPGAWLPAWFPAWSRSLPWLVATVSGLALLLTLAHRRRQPAPAALAAVALALAERRLEEAAAERRTRQAAAHLEETWRQFLAARWGVPPCTPAARWGEEAGSRGADPQAAADLSRLADDLCYLRNAPQLSATSPLAAEAFSCSRRLLRRLR
jgi:hypothetical protein